MEPNQSNGVPEEVQETQHDIESPPPAPAHKEFQTLLQCFPDRSVHQVRPLNDVVIQAILMIAVVTFRSTSPT